MRLLFTRILSRKSRSSSIVYDTVIEDTLEQHGGNNYRLAIFKALSSDNEVIVLCLLGLIQKCISNVQVKDIDLYDAGFLPLRRKIKQKSLRKDELISKTAAKTDQDEEMTLSNSSMLKTYFKIHFLCYIFFLYMIY